MAKRKPITDLELVRVNADQLLIGIAQQQRLVAHAQATMEQELGVVRARHQIQLAMSEARLTELDEQLRALMRGASEVLFPDGKDREPLANGILIHTVTSMVHKARGLLAKLKDLGRRDAIKVVESVDWDALDKWSDDQLKAVGTRRKPVETFGYEVKE